jgi:hypothetical protein
MLCPCPVVVLRGAGHFERYPVVASNRWLSYCPELNPPR